MSMSSTVLESDEGEEYRIRDETSVMQTKYGRLQMWKIDADR